MRKLSFLLSLTWGLLHSVAAPAQQIVCERLLTTPGLQVRFPTACIAPNGEFIVSGAAQPVGSNNSNLATHTFVTRLQASGCDTVWTRRLPHSVPAYPSSAVRADARGIWLLTPDTINNVNSAPPFTGVRLWRLTSNGRVRRVTRPAANSLGEAPINLLAATDGGVFVQLQTEYRAGFLSLGVLRFDSALALRWRRDYGLAGNNRAASLCYTSAGKVLSVGTIGIGPNYNSYSRLLEIESSRGDSVRGAALAWGPAVTNEATIRYNSQPLDAIALTGGGYVLPSVVNAPTIQTGQITCVDNNYNVLWRYQLPITGGTNADIRQFMQVRELADGTLVALVGLVSSSRTFWLYRFSAATGALLAVYPFTSPLSTLQLYPAHLLPVASDSSLLVVGGSRVVGTTQAGGIYVARLRVPGLPRVVVPALPLAARAGGAAAPAFALYPNPASGAVTVELPARFGAGRLELRDALGRLVRAQAVGAGPQALRWSLVGLAPGLYAVVLRGPGGAAVRRLAVE